MVKSQPHPQPTASPAPLRVGVAGLTRDGLFHVESLALRREFTPVAAAGTEARNVDGLSGCRQVSPEELLDQKLDLAIIATSAETRSQVAREFLARGTSVLIEAGIADLQRSSLEECLRLAGERRLFCGIWQPAFSEPDFLMAKRVAEADGSGEVRSARVMQHELAPGLHSPESARNVIRNAARLEAGCVCAIAVARQRLAQLLELVPVPVSSIQAKARFNDGLLVSCPAADECSGSTGTDPGFATSATLFIEFESGATGLIDIDVAAATSLNTGWVLQTTRGGYSAGRQVSLEPDGEVFAVPIEPAPEDPYSALDRVLRSSPTQQFQESQQSVRKELSISRLMSVLPVSGS